MQDRFKFRAYFIPEEYYVKITQLNFDAEGNITEIKFIKPKSVDPGGSEYICYQDQLNKFVFEQCTGLKDKNDKLIYEGDIVEVTSPENWNIFDEYSNSEILGKGVVVTKPGCAFIKKNDIDGEEKKYYFALYSVVEDASVEVIGNIHENSELLEDNK